MNDFDLQSMEKVVAFIGEPDEQIRRELRQILGHAGIKQISAHGVLANLTNMVGSVSPDLIVLADDLDPKVFDFIRDLRHNKVGTNPFVVIITLVAPERVEAVKRAMQVGADDIIVKPMKEEQILQRLKRLMINRSAFVVTSDYLGPDRRAKNRPSAIKRINVLNTMLDKATGKDVDSADVRDAVDGAMNEVLQARLDSHGLRLGFVCNLILDAYKKQNVTPEVQEKLRVLVNVLRDAAKTAERLEEQQLALLCGSLSGDVAAIAERYTTTTDKDLALIQKISTAVVSAVKPRATPDKLEEETRAAAQTYQQRQRSNFSEAQEIQRAPGEEPVVTMDEPVIEILPLAKGQFLFKQGDPATSAYILNSGLIGIFKEVDGKRQPIARVKKGEFFGEMAIIDGRPRRNSAMALEDCTLSLVSKDMIEEKLASSDSLVRTLLHMLSNSLRMVHEAYAPKGRNMGDAVREMKDQARYIQNLLETGSAERRKDGTAIAKKMAEISDALVKQIESAPDLDRRTPAVPTEKDLAH
jgi:CRP-like cAMP-binding protein/AmiR/NasT family two-component response regulator